MKKISFALFALVLATALYGCFGKPANLSSMMVDMMVRGYGGEENLKKLDSYVSIWEMDAVSRGTKGSATNYVVQPGKLRVELVYPNRSETRALDGPSGVKGYDGSDLKPVAGPMVAAMKLQRMRLYTPLTLRAKQENLTLASVEPFKILTLKEGNLEVDYYIKTDTYLIDHVVGKMKMGERVMEFKTLYRDYKEVDGVFVHHKEVKYAGGVNTAILTLKEIKLNETLGKNLFTD